MTELLTTEDGSSTLKSSQFEALYHSKHGAIQESQVVFIEAGLHRQMNRKGLISVLEVGFGTGLNAFLTYLEAQRHHLQITYTGVEAYPIPSALAAQLNYPELLQANAVDQLAFQQMHELKNVQVPISPQFLFCKAVHTFEAIEVKEAYDVVYYDAFSPSVQPELWELEAFQRMYQAMRPNGVLTTYCAKGAVKRTLKAVGFEIEALPGPIGKREMTRAIKPLT